MVKFLITAAWKCAVAQARILAPQMRIFPPGVWITLTVVILVGGRWAWVQAQKPPHWKEIIDAYGSVSLYSGGIYTDRTGDHLTYVATSDHGWGLFLFDTLTKRRTLLREVPVNEVPGEKECLLTAWPWSLDGGAFAYSQFSPDRFCVIDNNGAIVTQIDMPETVINAVGLSSNSWACVGTSGTIYNIRETDHRWTCQSVVHKTLTELADLAVRTQGGVASSSTTNTSAEKVFDNDTNTSWSSPRVPAWTQYHFVGAAWAITHYRLIASAPNDSSAPRDWSLLGSNDGKNWTILDNRTNQQVIPYGNQNLYSFTNPVPYAFYRLNITATAGQTTNGVRLAELQLFSKITPWSATASDANPPGEGAAACFDGSLDTKWYNANRSQTGWLQYTFANGAGWAINRYSVTSANDVPDRDPADWTLKASNDGTNWTLLDARSAEAFDSRKQTQTYDCVNNTPYRIYKFDILKSQAPGQGLQFSELAFACDSVPGVLNLDDADPQATNAQRYNLAECFSLCALTTNTIAWGQGSRICTLNLDNAANGLILNLKTALPGKTLQGFSYSQKDKIFFLTCSEENQDPTLWTYAPSGSGPKLSQIADSIQNPISLNNGAQGWLGRRDNYLVAQQSPAAEKIKFPQHANIDSVAVSPECQRIFLLATVGGDPSRGIWQYDLTSGKLQSLVSYADSPSPYAKRIDPQNGTLTLSSGQRFDYSIYSPINFDRRKNHKYPLIIGYTPFSVAVRGEHGRLWIPAVSACGAYVVIIHRVGWWDDLDHWGETVSAVYAKIAKAQNLDPSHVYLFGASAETRYMSQFITNSSIPIRGVILLNPTSVPDFTAANRTKPKILLSSGGAERVDGWLNGYQRETVRLGAPVDVFIHPGESHHLVGNAAQLERTRAIVNFIFNE